MTEELSHPFGLACYLPPLFGCQLRGSDTTTFLLANPLRLGRKAGTQERVHAHGFRHTHAAELRAEGIDVGIISKQLGHSSIATTARYLDHIAPQAVLDTIRRREWTADGRA